MNQIRDRVEIQFEHNICTVGLDRLGANVQNRRHFFIGFAFRDELNRFSLARRQECVRSLASRAFLVARDPLRNFSCEKGSMPPESIHGREKAVVGIFLQQVSASARLQNFAHQSFRTVRAQNKHFRVWLGLADLARRFHSAQTRHTDVQDGHVRLERFGLRHGFAAV